MFIKSWLRSRRQNQPAPVYDIGKLPFHIHLKVTGSQKRALLSYLTTPFRLSSNDPCNIQFSNIGIARSIVRILNELGYITDVVEWTDTKFLPRRHHYTLFIGHGGHNFEHIARNLSSDTVKIYFSSGCYWQFHNEQEMARFASLEKRRGVRLSPDRLITTSEEWANSNADGIICLGNEIVRETYSKFPVVFSLNNAAYHDDRYEQMKKDFVSARRNFLFFSGSGNVHKGLDLLLETFIQVDAHLYICQGISPEFYEVYRHELGHYPNIHLVGPVSMRSPQFYKLVDKCAFVIHPSCAEGQPGSVVECMHQGLIPVVSRESNIDTKNYGIILNACSIEKIVEVVQNLSQCSPVWCKEMSRRTRKAADTDFSETAFLSNMKGAIQKVIAHRATKQEAIMDPFFVDENLNVSIGQNAKIKIESRNDERFLQEGEGIIKVDVARWTEAQCYERRTWLEGDGRQAREDRNSEHARNFDNYAAIRGHYFNNAIEIGCGPFTNMVHILKSVKCRRMTFLDPLINDYLTHPHCAYKHKRLGRWFGKKVRVVAEPIENFSADQMFDLVVMINVLEHCFSVSKVFRSIISLMVPGGILVFHDKLIPVSALADLVRNIYDAGHPLRVTENIILEFLSKNFDELFSRNIAVPSTAYTFDSIYFIGRKRVR